ncbi:hypothetical protein B0H14DRAFT_2566004 [Mycena olivaceomarginata]|nr:hypothetical protein B0H14DRAFT_2566004 [Mycena olivaceomarginata]
MPKGINREKPERDKHRDRLKYRDFATTAGAKTIRDLDQSDRSRRAHRRKNRSESAPYGVWRSGWVCESLRNYALGATVYVVGLFDCLSQAGVCFEMFSKCGESVDETAVISQIAELLRLVELRTPFVFALLTFNVWSSPPGPVVLYIVHGGGAASWLEESIPQLLLVNRWRPTRPDGRDAPLAHSVALLGECVDPSGAGDTIDWTCDLRICRLVLLRNLPSYEVHQARATARFSRASSTSHWATCSTARSFSNSLCPLHLTGRNNAEIHLGVHLVHTDIRDFSLRLCVTPHPRSLGVVPSAPARVFCGPSWIHCGRKTTEGTCDFSHYLRPTPFDALDYARVAATCSDVRSWRSQAWGHAGASFPFEAALERTLGRVVLGSILDGSLAQAGGARRYDVDTGEIDIVKEGETQIATSKGKSSRTNPIST